jgi:hypothetical protein
MVYWPGWLKVWKVFREDYKSNDLPEKSVYNKHKILARKTDIFDNIFEIKFVDLYLCLAKVDWEWHGLILIGLIDLTPKNTKRKFRIKLITMQCVG